MFARRWLLTWAAVTCVGLLGCGASGPPRVKFGGKVTDGGQLLKVPTGGFAQISFIPLDGPPGKTDGERSLISPENGTYKIIGRMSDGVLLGKYKVTVAVYRTMDKDELKGKFDEKHSPIEREITATTTDVSIDLSKPNG